MPVKITKAPRQEMEHVLSNAVLSVSWHGGGVCRRVVWLGLGYSCVDVTAGVLRMLDGPLADLVGTEGDEGEGECQEQILCKRDVSVRPRLGRVVVVQRFI